MNRGISHVLLFLAIIFWWLAVVPAISISPLCASLASGLMICGIGAYFFELQIFAVLFYSAAILLPLWNTQGVWLLPAAFYGLCFPLLAAFFLLKHHSPNEIAQKGDISKRKELSEVTNIPKFEDLSELETSSDRDNSSNHENLSPRPSSPRRMPARLYAFMSIWLAGLVLITVFQTPDAAIFFLAWSCIMVFFCGREWSLYTNREWFGYKTRRNIFVSLGRWKARFMVAIFGFIAFLAVFYFLAHTFLSG